MWQALWFFSQKKEEKTLSLFDRIPMPPLPCPPPSQRPYPEHLMRTHESEALGLVLSIHPLQLYQEALKDHEYVCARDLSAWIGKGGTTIGWQVTGKTVHTKDGEAMKFVSFEDLTGLYEAVFFPKTYNRYCHMFNTSRPYILKGQVEEDFSAITLTVHWMGFLDSPSSSIRHESC